MVVTNGKTAAVVAVLLSVTSVTYYFSKFYNQVCFFECMANDSEQIELLKKHGIQQVIPYIYKLAEFYYCIYHLGLKPLKLGNMIKHAHGHYHRTEWETNKPYKKPKRVEKNQNNTESQKLESIRSERELIDHHCHIATELCKLDRDLAIKIAYRDLSGPFRTDMMIHLYDLQSKDESKRISEDKEFIKATVKGFLALIPRQYN